MEKNRLESKVVPLIESNLLEIVDILDRTKNYIPYCNFRCHEGVIRKLETEKLDASIMLDTISKSSN